MYPSAFLLSVTCVVWHGGLLLVPLLLKLNVTQLQHR